MYFKGINFNVNNVELFEHSLEGLRKSIAAPDAFFCSDNIITWNRTTKFFNDEKFVNAVKSNATDDVEVSILWRTYVLCHFAEKAKKLDGDFLEVGAYKGTTASIISDRVGLEETGKSYYLYDLFEHTGSEENHAMPEHGPELCSKVTQRFASRPFVKVIKGYVPDSFSQGFPEKVAFAHIDLNQATAEVGALEMILPRLVYGGVVIMDDYGWFYYRAQQEAEDPVFARFGLDVLELPTGQGLVINI